MYVKKEARRREGGYPDILHLANDPDISTSRTNDTSKGRNSSLEASKMFELSRFLVIVNLALQVHLEEV